jgi:hypothetical protein
VASATATVAPATTTATTAIAAASSTAAITAAASTVTATAATTTSTAGWARFAGPGFVHRQWTTFDGLPVELGDCRLSVGLRSHRHEGKAARLAGEFVLHERHLRDRSGLRKKLLQFVFRRIEGKIAYV